ncbi:glycosyltransferase family 4 protein, partial [Candidatus Gracilibacteria bacterium]|nr:glycosyltransferase family 4 protein [Candidatus Gracilibacteria bacterium]
MHILFLTWKDVQHPHAGGAEKVMYEYASGLVELGHTVTWFASSFAGAAGEEYRDGIHIIRRYTNHTIWIFAWLWYKEYKKSNPIDIIIDEAGGWPLLSPLYEREIPIFFFVHHIGDREFDAFPTPIGQVARWIYHGLFSIYRDIPTIAVSSSTRDELVHRFGYPMSNISIIENT